MIRDPIFLEYLDKIGQNFFGLAPPVRPRPGGMFSGLFDSLLNVLGEEDDAGAASRPAAGSRTATGRRPGPAQSTSSRMETEDVE